MNDEVLLESQTLRNQVVDQVNPVDILNKVKALVLLPDDLHATIEQVAEYYEVPYETIESLIRNHRDELEMDGLKVLKGKELEEFVSLIKKETNTGTISPKTRSLTIIPRRGILRIGFLLRDSRVARDVRTYALDVEEITRREAPQVTLKAAGINWNRVLVNVNAKQKLFQMVGLSESAALAYALDHEELEAGVNLSTFKRLIRDKNVDKTITSTELGQRLNPPQSARKVNRLLEMAGLQVRTVNKEWEPTEDGKPYAEVLITVIRHPNRNQADLMVETQKKAIRWKEDVLTILQRILKEEKMG